MLRHIHNVLLEENAVKIWLIIMRETVYWQTFLLAPYGTGKGLCLWTVYVNMCKRESCEVPRFQCIVWNSFGTLAVKFLVVTMDLFIALLMAVLGLCKLWTLVWRFFLYYSNFFLPSSSRPRDSSSGEDRRNCSTWFSKKSPTLSAILSSIWSSLALGSSAKGS